MIPMFFLGVILGSSFVGTLWFVDRMIKEMNKDKIDIYFILIILMIIILFYSYMFGFFTYE